ncbi:major facilitator superfamily domain-containing protein [Gongronella butleri]|nr:major facilitator superfamily domain-containing protein [Gongronella butleri]
MAPQPWYLALKLLSVFSIGCVGSAMLYLPTFYEKILHLGTDKIGVLYAITPFVSCFSFPYWTAYLDKHPHAYKRTMIQNMLLGWMAVLSIAVVPLITDNHLLALLLVSVGNFGFSWFGYPIIAAAVDTVIFMVLGDNKALYGQQKIGCPIGYGLAVFLTGMGMQFMGAYALFVVYSVCVIAFVITVAVMDLTPATKPEDALLSTESHHLHGDESDSSASSYGSLDNGRQHDHHHHHAAPMEAATGVDPVAASASIWSLLRDRDAARFFAVMVTTGFAIAIVQAFLFLFMQKDLGASPALVGWLGPLGSSTEIIFFFFSKPLFAALGPKQMLLGGQVLIVLRCSLYMLAIALEHPHGAWVATATQLLHGASYALIWSSSALQANDLAPDALKARAQGMLNMCFNGIGSGLGAIFGGIVYQALGANTMWLIVACLTAVSMIVYYRQSPTYNRVPGAPVPDHCH